MKPVATLLISLTAQSAYFAIILSAFIIVPTTRYFGPCACTIILPPTEPTLVMFSNLRVIKSRNSGLSGDAARSGDPLCPEANRSLDHPASKVLTLGPDIENLIYRHDEPVKVCMQLDEAGKVTMVRSHSPSLSIADEQLISDFIANNWSFAFTRLRHSDSVAGTYALELEVRDQLKPPIPPAPLP